MKLLTLITLLAAAITQCTAQISEDFETDSITSHTLVASWFINDEEGWLADDGGVIWHTSNGGESWNFLYDESGTCFIPDWGIYQTLDGINDLFLAGKNGTWTKWE